MIRPVNVVEKCRIMTSKKPELSKPNNPQKTRKLISLQIDRLNGRHSNIFGYKHEENTAHRHDIQSVPTEPFPHKIL
ncbi:hypothetical protein G3O00_15955 [Burkholderia sp. Ac-20384]|uniref:hypothetical protein n=1 Tax=Burkholderia sp. Ac-20384 TaxID=2703902 RepID=UPI00198156C3|nr:hypothetical protein [Burkholderia sp. Ac-20384]MBN3825101.1 hypothetical protein [Burkholderia sp. Ac-20384]